MLNLELPRRLPTNATTKEIIGHVRHLYPQLGPVLNQLVEKLECSIEHEREIKDLEEQCETHEMDISKLKDQLVEADAQTREGSCPHCGSRILLELKT